MKPVVSSKKNQKKQFAFGRNKTACAGFVLILAASLFLNPQIANALPRANIIAQVDRELLEKLKDAVGEVDSPAQSAFEARSRAALAKEYAEELLRAEGYYQSNITIDVSEGDNPKAIIKVETGPLFIIEEPKISWQNTPPNDTTLKAVNSALQLKPNAAAKAQDIIDIEAKILGAVLSRGYANAVTLPKKIIVDHSSLKMQPTFAIDAGELVKFGNLQIIGDTKINEKWLNAFSPIKAGENFDPNDIKTLERRLLETGAFDSVSISLAPKSDAQNQRPVQISLTDRARLTTETDVSYATNDGFSIEERLGQYNILGRGDSLINRFIWGDIEKRIEGEWRFPHFKYPDQTLAFSLGAFQDDTKAYREKGIDGKVEVTRKLGPTSFWTLGLATNIARTREPSFLNPSTGIERDYAAFNLVGAFLLDNTDNSLNPSSGYKADFKIEPTTITGDAQLSYVKMLGQATYYHSFDDEQKSVFAARGRIGSIIGGTIPELPSGKRLYAGGGGSVRGYEYQAIGPHYNDIDNTPVGGLSLIEASFEYRHSFKNKFGIVAFIDTGTLGIDQTPDFKEFKAGAGLGFRYDLGFAPLRIDVGVPLNKEKGDASFQIYIGVGQSF